MQKITDPSKESRITTTNMQNRLTEESREPNSGSKLKVGTDVNQ